MPFRVLLFGPYAEAIKHDHALVTLSHGTSPTAARVLDALGEAHPPLRLMLPAARLAVNGAMARPHHLVRESDELAVIGLVGGG